MKGEPHNSGAGRRMREVDEQRDQSQRMVPIDSGFLWDGSWVTSDAVRILG